LTPFASVVTDELADVVTEQVGQRPIRADSETSRAREIVFRDDRVLHFVVIAHVVGGHAVDGGLNLLAVRIVVEVGRGRAGDGDESVLGSEKNRRQSSRHYTCSTIPYHPEI
jgi:hypothetical protein